MTPLSSGYFTSSMTNVLFAAALSVYISTTSSYDLRAETTYGRTWLPSATNATRVITSTVPTATARG